MNKTVLAASMVLAMVASACASAPTATSQAHAAPQATAPGGDAPASLTLTVANVRAGAGPVMIALFDSQAGWEGAAASVRSAQAAADAANVTVRFEGLPLGTYGVKLYQDIDRDGRMGTNPFGIPNEPFGFSNDAPVRFGPPGWDAARFAVTAPTTSQTITLP